jgi:hypothetical protein
LDPDGILNPHILLPDVASNRRDRISG